MGTSHTRLSTDRSLTCTMSWGIVDMFWGSMMTTAPADCRRAFWYFSKEKSSSRIITHRLLSTSASTVRASVFKMALREPANQFGLLMHVSHLLWKKYSYDHVFFFLFTKIYQINIGEIHKHLWNLFWFMTSHEDEMFDKQSCNLTSVKGFYLRLNLLVI